MSIAWDNEELSRKMFSMVKTDGFFKSVKQSNYFRRNYKNDDLQLDLVGVPALLEGQFVVTVGGMTRWADYGTRSMVPVTFVFICDLYGVVTEYKLKYRGNLRDGCSPDGSQTKKVWERSTSIQLPLFEEEKKPEQTPSSSQFLGNVGDWLETDVTLKNIRYIGQDYYGNAQYITKMIDDFGNEIIAWSFFKGLHMTDQENGGRRFKLRAKVKAHETFRDVNQTIVYYAKVLN